MFKKIVFVVNVLVRGHDKQKDTKRSRKTTDQLVSNVEGLNKELITNLMGYYYCHWMGMESLYTVCVRTGCFP